MSEMEEVEDAVCVDSHRSADWWWVGAIAHGIDLSSRRRCRHSHLTSFAVLSAAFLEDVGRHTRAIARSSAAVIAIQLDSFGIRS